MRCNRACRWRRHRLRRDEIVEAIVAQPDLLPHQARAPFEARQPAPVRGAIEREAQPGVTRLAIETRELRIGGQGQRRAGKPDFQRPVLHAAAERKLIEEKESGEVENSRPGAA